MDVKEEVKQKVSSIQDTIACIAQVQQHLKNNCIEAKSNVHSSISRQLETLRSREVWLLNQVDVIRHIKEERLQGQLACLLHELGGLQHLIQIAQSCGENCADLKRELMETLNRLKDLDDVPVENADIQFKADMIQLRRAVCNFGSIVAQGHTMEDYPMTEALCSSLGELNLMDQATVFPPFDCATSLTDWLADNATDDFVMLENDYHKLKMPSFDQQSDEVKTSDEYFHDVTLSPVAEWLLDCGRFQADFAVDKSYPFVMKYFREISNDIRDWLVGYEKSQEEDMEEDTQSKDCKEVCHCTGPPDGFVMQAIEIENLADMLTCIQDPVGNTQKNTQTDMNEWLRTVDKPSMKSDSSPPFILPSVKSACKGNETCQDFTECVCDTNCAAEAIAQENPSLERDQVLSYFQRVSKNSSDWLLPKCFEKPSENSQKIPQESNDQWLMGEQNLQKECSFPQFNSDANTSEWLMENSPQVTQSSKVNSSPLENYHEPTTEWLVKEVDLKLNISDECSEPTPFDAYFNSQSCQTNGWLVKEAPDKESKTVDNIYSNKDVEKNEQWLQHTHSSESQSVDGNCWEVVKKYHAQMVQSDWLKSQFQPQTKSEWLLCDSLSNNSVATKDEAFKMFLCHNGFSDDKQWLKD